MFRYTVGLIVLLALLPASILISQESRNLPVVRIGIVLDGPEAEGRAFSDLVEREIRELTSGEFDVRFPEEKVIVADWSMGGVSRAVDQLLLRRRQR